MRYEVDKCICCGSHAQPTHLEFDPYIYDRLNPDGTFSGSSLWFCSLECYRKTINPYIKDKRFLIECDYTSEPKYEALMRDWMRRTKLINERGWLAKTVFSGDQKYADKLSKRMDDFALDWMKQQHEAVVDAVDDAVVRIYVELAHQEKIFQAALEEEQRKEDERLQKQAARDEQQRLRDEERRQERERREQEKAADRASREEYQRKREMERQEDKRQREEEKRKRELEKTLKEEEEQAAKEAEEEKWKPQDFDI